MQSLSYANLVVKKQWQQNGGGSIKFVRMQNSIHPNQETKKLKKVTIKTDRKLKDIRGMDAIFCEIKSQLKDMGLGFWLI